MFYADTDTDNRSPSDPCVRERRRRCQASQDMMFKFFFSEFRAVLLYEFRSLHASSLPRTSCNFTCILADSSTRKPELNWEAVVSPTSWEASRAGGKPGFSSCASMQGSGFALLSYDCCACALESSGDAATGNGGKSGSLCSLLTLCIRCRLGKSR